MDIIQIGKTVLFLYPTPNSRKPPSGVYIKDGFIEWTIKNNSKNREMENDNL